MRIFRYWAEIERTIQVGDQSQAIHCFGGSNDSMEKAQKDARERSENVARKISGKLDPQGEYEVDIREEVLSEINSGNIVTRNRYGAEVLNSVDLMFVDMDEPKSNWWNGLWSGGKGKDPKKKIVERVKQKSSKPSFQNLGIRLYETCKGVRAIVTGRSFDPKSEETHRLMKDLHVDELYARLCIRQGCFRARLSPKPYRMKQPRIKIIHPRTQQSEEEKVAAWVQEYNRKRTAFSTCRFICSWGHESRNEVIQFHDKATGAFSGLNLA